MNNWRLPTLGELRLLWERHPETHCDSNFWSGSPYAGNPNGAWYVGFDSGYAYSSLKNSTLAVRLVHDEEIDDPRYINMYGMAFDRCAVGQEWVDGRVVGEPSLIPWNKAMELMK